MVRQARRRLVCMLACLVPLGGHADIDESEYEFKKTVRSATERKRLEGEFRAAQQVEAELARHAAAQEVLRLAAEKAAWSALPYPVRLIQIRCTYCHSEDSYLKQRHNRVGWELVILRMQYLNDAQLPGEERAVIASHLAENYPQTVADALAEGAMQLGVVLLPAVFWLGWKLTRERLGGGPR